MVRQPVFQPGNAGIVTPALHSRVVSCSGESAALKPRRARIETEMTHEDNQG
jgi:hypothetical protein